jgi:hypothetical protein
MSSKDYEIIWREDETHVFDGNSQINMHSSVLVSQGDWESISNTDLTLGV